MKKCFTKMLALVVLFCLGFLSVQAQTTTYSGTFPITAQGLAQLYTSPLAAGWAASSSAPSASDRSGRCFTSSTTEPNFNSGRNITYRLPNCGTMTLQANGTVGRGFIVTVKKVSDASQLSRTVWPYTSATCSTQDFVINSSVPVDITILSPTTIEGAITATGSSYLSYMTITQYVAPTPQITGFTANGITATIDQTAGTIAATLVYGTDLSSITPVVTLGGTATIYTPTGAQNFSSGAVNYVASDGTTTKTYAVTLSVPATPPAPVISLSSGAVNQAVKVGGTITNIVYNLTNATDATVVGLPAGLSGNFVSTGTNIGTYTISGAVDAGVTPGAFNYTVTATAISGYSGSSVTSAGLVAVKTTSARSICYLVAAATQSANDTQLYPNLYANPNYMVTLRTAATSVPAATVYDGYDVIIINEIVSGTNAEAVSLKSIDKPILSLKAFTYNAGRWAWGVPDNGLSTNGVVTLKQATHPIFNGIDVSAGTLSLLTGATGNGIQPADVTLLSGRSINVATAPKSTTGNPMAVAIHDVPASVRGVSNSKYIMIPVSDASYPYMNSTFLSLINNALDYLLSGTQFVAPTLEISSFSVNSVSATINNTANTINATLPIGTGLSALQPTIMLAGVGTTVSPASTVVADFTNSGTTAVNYTVTDGISSKVYAVKIVEGTTGLSHPKITGVYFDGKTIHNSTKLDLQVFDATGRRIAGSNNDIDMSTYSRGVYFVKSDSGNMKILF